ncbi:hypothetical protein BN2497_8431 [Janthinobacterium sp. CG23_2]|nr:hypothetical protein BN2497_8431 [Janthinobacterium sp. CG23_2]CUU30613.1 hypothetical protein BN3177_8431 [Janthinobacterium sp. CG23_2]
MSRRFQRKGKHDFLSGTRSRIVHRGQRSRLRRGHTMVRG